MKKEVTNKDFVQMEHEMLDLWHKEKFFEKLVEKNKNGERYRFLDGPITANNSMGIHHAWGRTLKDTFIKYKAMKGFSCQYQNGFDAQGLWVEVETEKQLGFKNKQDIEKYGLDNFTNACMDRVKKYSGVITEQSKRLGQWMDWDNSYYTNSDENITSIWHFLKVCNEHGWLEKRYKAMPWCPRCGTSLSEHEMTGSYKDVECDAVFFKLPLKNEKVKMLAWTTTPWTLTSNVALAVNPELNYVYARVKSDSDLLVLCESAVKVLRDDLIEIVKTVKGLELVGKEYETCFAYLEPQKFAHKIVPWEAVDATEGVGVVHIAPGCGAEDFELGLKHNLKQVCPIDDAGIILPEFGQFAGKSTTEVAPLVFEKLKEQNKLYKTHKYAHSYPFCWRCKTDIVFKLVDGWYIKTEELKPRLIAAAKTVKWQPEHAGKRMFDWLNNMGDWNISRKRFYGLPLPFYTCDKCGKVTVIGSKEELTNRSSEKEVKALPHLHRPWIDNIKIKCDCGGTATRITDVGDCWLDAGISPFSTKKYFTDKEYWKKNFPSECVIEMIEQVRLWFYSLLFMSVVLEDKAPYEKVLAYESVVKEDGGKFSKSGFMIKFEEAAEKMGADPIRYMYAGASIANDVRFGYNLGDEAKRKLMGFWNTYVFFNLYAVLDKPELDGYEPDEKSLDITDKWLIERTNEFIKLADNSYAEYDTPTIVKEFENYVDQLSNWYIRINRRRFWKSKDLDQKNAYYCLYHAIKTVIQIMAPILPFMTEYIWQNLVREMEKKSPESIHLSAFPEKIYSISYPELITETKIVRDIVYLAQKLRNESQIKLRQPLKCIYLKVDDSYEKAIADFKDVIHDEVNVRDVIITGDDNKFSDVVLGVDFRKAGAVLKQRVNELKAALESASKEEMAHLVDMYNNSGKVKIANFDDPLDKEIFVVKYVCKKEFATAKLDKNLVVLDIEIDEQLTDEGNLRELLRQLQVARKEAGFSIDDRIILNIVTDNEYLQKHISKNLDAIKKEVLALSTEKLSEFEFEKLAQINDYEATIRLSRIKK